MQESAEGKQKPKNPCEKEAAPQVSLAERSAVHHAKKPSNFVVPQGFTQYRKDFSLQICNFWYF